MYAIRGAITIKSDTVENVKEATVRLYKEILCANHLKPDSIATVFCTSTSDIKSYYPVAAVRADEPQFSIPLFSATEPDIQNGLPLCIRLMILVDDRKPKEVNHIYLEGAAVLRPDLVKE